MTAAELAETDALLRRCEQGQDLNRQLKALGAGAPDVSGPGGDALGRPGDQVIASAGYKAIRGSRGAAWSTGPIEIETKATLFEGSLGSPGAGAALAQPDVRPGVVQLLSQPPTVVDLLAQAPTSSNVVRVIVETVASNAAAATAEGDEKPEAALEFDEVDEPVRKVAVFLPVSDELLEDAPALQAYINARLGLFVRQEEEDQILNGRGHGVNLTGLLNRIPAGNRGVTSTATAASAIDHVYAAISKARQSYLEPDGIVIHPSSWEMMRLLKDGDENYIGGSPFSTGPGEPSETLFGKRVAITTAIDSGQALVGSFQQGAQLFRRGGLTIEISNSHSDWFRRNLEAIRAESRIALAVFRGESFALADLEIS